MNWKDLVQTQTWPFQEQILRDISMNIGIPREALDRNGNVASRARYEREVITGKPMCALCQRRVESISVSNNYATDTIDVLCIHHGRREILPIDRRQAALSPYGPAGMIPQLVAFRRDAERLAGGSSIPPDQPVKKKPTNILNHARVIKFEEE